MTTVKAWAAMSPGTKLDPFTYELSPLGPEEVEIKVDHCGICHTDLSFLHNEPGFIPFPLVAGHEIIGTVVTLGDVAKEKGLYPGQKVGLGWNKESCGHCEPCLAGDQNLCVNLKATIISNHGGFASHVKAHWLWTVPIPEKLNAADAGPLLCAGITVFGPLMQFDVRPTHRIGIFGIGGLGHLAVQFAHAWGAEVTAFSNSAHKKEDILKLGADQVVSSRDTSEWETLKGKFDLILITVAVPLEWDKIIAMLGPKGRLHLVGIVYEPIPVKVMQLLLSLVSISASPGGTRSEIGKMLEFAARHNIGPIVEHFPMSRINEAIAYVEAGKANYRVVLDADFK
jgi:uncharacterized zinc-type alcohol dehydrogenase-like protein